ncbi:hypothetical protein CCYA_CCYA02G0768 [Cyanidiococcus yangmingshanensis]|nr:hypothetical protein CCYA_CCYA02G0768 [Cyanidiococcus yangmingshanensis]
MTLSIGSLLLSTLLFTNAVVVLNEDRFLSRIGWQRNQPIEAQGTLKARLVALLYAVQMLLPIPLIFVNLIATLLLLVFG